MFVGKLIGSKGVELLLAAWPLVLASEPAARLVVVGFGGFREGLEALARPTSPPATWRPPAPRAPRTAASCRGWPPSWTASRTPRPTARRRAGMTDRIAWAGRLDHAELADLLPAAEAMAVTSTFPEAFGMVAAEAAACGALPVVSNHSGLGEVARTLSEAVPEPARGWLTFERRARGRASSPPRSPAGSPRPDDLARARVRRSSRRPASATPGRAWRAP